MPGQSECSIRESYYCSRGEGAGDADFYTLARNDSAKAWMCVGMRGAPLLGRGPRSPSRQCSAGLIHAIDRENQSPLKILYHSFVYPLTQLTPIRCAQVSLGRGWPLLIPHLKACSLSLQTPHLRGGCHVSLALPPRALHQAAPLSKLESRG